MSGVDAPAVLRSDRPDLEVRRLLWQLALWPRGWQAMPWLHPGQRWRETRVACMVARDQVSRLMRSFDVPGNVRAN